MSILEKNIEKFGVKFSCSGYVVGDLLINADEEFLVEPDFNTNRTLFLAYELTSIEQILRLLEGLNEKSMMLLYYRDERCLYELLSKVDFTSREDKIIFFAGDYRNPDKISELEAQIRSIIYTFSNIQPMIRKSENIDYIRGAKEFLKFVGDFRENYIFMLGNDMNDTLYGLRNRILNLATYIKSPGFRAFKVKYGHLYKDKPAIVVASGPSLDKNVHYLKGYQNKALILSCDGSLSTLRRHGIKPDVIGSIERVYKTYESFYKDKDIDPDIVFCGPAVVRPEIVEKFDGKRILSIFKDKDMYGIWMNSITLENKGTVWSGTSVAHFLTNFADALGCNPIILIGQDLAYSMEGISHAGDAEVKERVDISKITEWVKDYNGNDIPSTYVWKNFLHTFEEIARLTDKTIIDATEGGALIKGTRIQSLKETLEEYCNSELPAFNELVESIEVEEEYIDNARESSYRGIVKAIDDFEELLSRVKKGKNRNKKAVSIIERGIKTQKQLDGIYDNIDYIDDDIVKYIAKDAFLMMLFQYPIYRATMAINNLNTDKYTLETINYNLLLHKELLDIFELYINKMIRVLIDGLKDNRNLFQKIPGYDDKLNKLCNTYYYLYKSNKYDISLI